MIQLRLDKEKGGESYMLNGIGTTEIVVVSLVLLMLFGGKKLPQLAKGVGDSIKEFRKAVSETV